MQSFILASASPQRRTLLEGIGVQFQVIPSGLDESLCVEVDPGKRAQVLATMKAKDVASTHHDAFVLGVDTLVVAADGTLLEKPVDADDARRMLQMHSGNMSLVHSAMCLITPEGQAEEVLHTSKVMFKDLSEADIEWWISTGEWKDRSGSFQIDGKGQMLIQHLEGDWTSVVGLPIYELGLLLEKVGFHQK